MPNPGGLFQQLPGHIKRLEIVYRARNAVESEKLGRKSGTIKSDTAGPDMSKK